MYNVTYTVNKQEQQMDWLIGVSIAVFLVAPELVKIANLWFKE